jgi:hypothetical protein
MQLVPAGLVVQMEEAVARQIALLGKIQATAHAQIGPRPCVHRHMLLQGSRVADPDWIRIQSAQWIRIRIGSGFNRLSGSGSGFNRLSGSGSGLDTDSIGSVDPDWIRIQSAQWIRIRIQSAQGIRIRIQSAQWIRIQEGKNDPTKVGKIFF